MNDKVRKIDEFFQDRGRLRRHLRFEVLQDNRLLFARGRIQTVAKVVRR